MATDALYELPLMSTPQYSIANILPLPQSEPARRWLAIFRDGTADVTETMLVAGGAGQRTAAVSSLKMWQRSQA